MDKNRKSKASASQKGEDEALRHLGRELHAALFPEPVIFIEVVFRVSVGPSDAMISSFCAGDEVWDDGKHAARVAAGPVGLFAVLM